MHFKFKKKCMVYLLLAALILETPGWQQPLQVFAAQMEESGTVEEDIINPITENENNERSGSTERSGAVSNNGTDTDTEEDIGTEEGTDTEESIDTEEDADVELGVGINDNTVSANAVELTEEVFPDSGLLSFLKEFYDADKNEYLSKEELEKITYISMGIQDLTGLEKLTSLAQLDVSGTEISNFGKLEEMTSLTHLNLSRTGMEDYSAVAELTNLVQLKLDGNKGTELDLGNLDNLQYLSCKDSSLTGVRLNGLSKLEELRLENNELRTLELTGLNSLEALAVQNNKLAALDVRACETLRVLQADNNELESLGVSGLGNLMQLDCQNNKLAAIDVSGLTALQQLNAYGNELTSLELEGLTALDTVLVGMNQLSGSLDTANAAMVGAEGNELENVTSGSDNLRYLNVRNNVLTEMTLSSAGLSQIYCSNNQLSALEIVSEVIDTIYCDNNNIPYMETAGATDLNLSPQSVSMKNVKNGTKYTADLRNIIPDSVSENCIKLIWGQNILGREDNIITLNGPVDSMQYDFITSLETNATMRVNVSLELEDITPGVALDETVFPDAKVRKILSQYDLDESGKLIDEEIASIEKFIYPSSGIKDITGMGYLTSLKYLDLSNDMTSVSANAISDFSEISSMTSLEMLKLDRNQGTAVGLDVRNAVNLQVLSAVDCGLTSVKAAGLAQLEELRLEDNALKELDLTGLSGLKVLTVQKNQLDGLSAASCTALEVLQADHNKLTSLNVSGLKNLVRLDCQNNDLGSLNVKSLEALQELNVTNNDLSSLDVSGLASLETVLAANNNLTGSWNAPAAEVISLEGNSITSLEGTGNSLRYLNVRNLNNNGLLKALALPSAELTHLYCSGNEIMNLDITSDKLQVIYCGNNRIPYLETSSAVDVNLSPQTIQLNSTYDDTLKKFTVDLKNVIPQNKLGRVSIVSTSGESMDGNGIVSFDSNLTSMAYKYTTTENSSMNTTMEVTIHLVTPITATVVFDKNSETATGTMENQIVSNGMGTKLTANAFVNEGYLFTGWNTKADGTGTSYTDCEDVSGLGLENGATITLYAQWQKEPEEIVPVTATIVFDKNSEAATGTMENQVISDGVGITLTPNAYMREGYLFDGWNTKADGTGISYMDCEDVSGLELENGVTITLYAQWKKEAVALDIPYANIGSGSSVKAGTEIILTTNIPGAQIYYTLDGSYPYKNGAPAESDILYTAPIVVDETSVDENGKIIITAIATKSGYGQTGYARLQYTLSDFGDVDPEDIKGEVVENIPDGLWIKFVGFEGEENKAGYQFVPEYTYKGGKITPEVEVYYKNELLDLKKEYTIAYKNNTKANDASDEKKAPTITVTGKGNYAGKVTATFKIVPKNLADESIETAETIYATYNKKTQKPAITIKDNGKKLGKKDFAVEYVGLEDNPDAFKEKGEYTIKIVGTGNYTGERTVKFVIENEKILISKASVSKIKNQNYNEGNPIEPEVTVRYKGEDLFKDTDYKVEYRNNCKVGTATVIIRGCGEYSGEKVMTFKILGTAINKAKVAADNIPKSMVYTGSEITYDTWGTRPELTIKAGTETKDLAESTDGKTGDYTVSYEKNVNAGTASVIFKGINGYTGTLKKTFKITPYDMQKDEDGKMGAKLADHVQPVYAKGGSKPKVAVSYTHQLIEGVDYTVSYKNNTAINDGSNSKKLPTATIKGKGNFKGSIPLTYTIAPQELSKMEITAADIAFKDGNKTNYFKTKLTVTDLDGKTLKAGTDYDKNIRYTYKDDTTVQVKEGKTYVDVVRKAGEEIQKTDVIPVNTVLVATISPKLDKEGNQTGNYRVTVENPDLSAEYRIVPMDINKLKVKVDTMYYDGTGKQIKPGKDKIKVYNGKDPLSDDVYEIVGYGVNNKKGTGTVIIKGVYDQGYGGIRTVKFTIKSRTFEWKWWK